ncbi:Pyruvate kinase (EC [Olavius algarvensis associated proteobacterium Delta 3]|nr:Pyruvate kinase (EC [Olavius algarvensis associated proteobacterium Delta 3]CAB5171934.1 Pyruvate kinase (EC [Olavius algarvensis associated proteobacterium Delta 3]
MALPNNKTKIVCTIGPASESPVVLEKMIQAGMNVARLNFSHGSFEEHETKIEVIRAAAKAVGRNVAIMGDLPGPKIRLGTFAEEPVELEVGDPFTLTTEDIIGDRSRVSVSFQRLPKVVRPGDRVYLNDGYLQLRVDRVEGSDVHCTVMVGYELRSRKGLNLPGIDLSIGAFTDHDLTWLKFAAEHKLTAVSQSFVENAADIRAVRNAAAELNYDPFIVAKIERSRAIDNIEEILTAVDGIMIARGDLGVEIPIESIAVVQKQLMRKANALGKPVITATQMLESMTANRRPTRAEATDVANAILDGTDAVMLSGESAMGRYPVDAVTMLARIAASIEPQRLTLPGRSLMDLGGDQGTIPRLQDLIALSVGNLLHHIRPAAVVVPTHSGATARSISRFRLPVWVVAVSSSKQTCQSLLLSYGVKSVLEPDHPANWRSWIRRCFAEQDIDGHLVILTEGPSRKHPNRNNRMEIIELHRGDNHHG